MKKENRRNLTGLRLRMYETIFESDSMAGKLFDIVLLLLIVGSVTIIILESVESFNARFRSFLVTIEWVFTALFTLEYAARIWTVQNRQRYIFSFFGIIDFLSILPSYLALFVPGAQALMVIRSIRLLRIFRILKLTRFVGEGQFLMTALRASKHKIIVFLFTVLTTVTIIGTVMYLIEGPSNGFTSIPRSIYWAIVTMTTVGYGDIAPKTDSGQLVAALLMIMGYGVIAVPTGIVSSEMVSMRGKSKLSNQRCPQCLREGHDPDAIHCKFCGEVLNPVTADGVE